MQSSSICPNRLHHPHSEEGGRLGYELPLMGIPLPLPLGGNWLLGGGVDLPSFICWMTALSLAISLFCLSSARSFLGGLMGLSFWLSKAISILMAYLLRLDRLVLSDSMHFALSNGVKPCMKIPISVGVDGSKELFSASSMSL